MAKRALALIAVSLVLLVGCAEDVPFAPSFNGTGGTGATGAFDGFGGFGGTGLSAGTGGVGGAAGAGATGGFGGTGGTGATGATGGVGGTGNAGGIGGVGGLPSECTTNDLCLVCPDLFICDSDSECFPGWGCFPTGCTDLEGDPINQCQELPGGFCNTAADCPTPLAPSPDYSCVSVVNAGFRCVKTTPGCDSDANCGKGFACESGECVDRRVPCVLDEDCPVNYSCETPSTSNRFCIRIHQSCEGDQECEYGANFCVDIDGDGRTECGGPLDLNGPACTNALCGGASPVCEASGVGPIAACGQYGLCLTNADCADSTFECKELGPEGRRECVKLGSTCDSTAEDCPLNQVCAAPRTGGPASCQAGTGL